MGELILGPWLHARASTRGGRRVSKSGVTPAALALSVDNIADHHSDGILSRFHHFRTVDDMAPTSEAIASRVGQRSTTERNEVKSVMGEVMGPLVPKIKALLSHDFKPAPGHTVPMEQDDENLADQAWHEGFRARLKQARGERSQEDMAELLCITRDAYSKYEGSRGTVIPTRLLPRFCKICAVRIEWLIEGDKAAKPAKQQPKAPRRA
jgi:hypothetical protein